MRDRLIVKTSEQHEKIDDTPDQGLLSNETRLTAVLGNEQGGESFNRAAALVKARTSNEVLLATIKQLIGTTQSMADKLARMLYVDDEPDIQMMARLALETPDGFAAKVQPSEVAQYKEFGAVEVIPRPFDPMTLASKVEEIWASCHG